MTTALPGASQMRRAARDLALARAPLGAGRDRRHEGRLAGCAPAPLAAGASASEIGVVHLHPARQWFSRPNAEPSAATIRWVAANQDHQRQPGPGELSLPGQFPLHWNGCKRAAFRECAFRVRLETRLQPGIVLDALRHEGLVDFLAEALAPASGMTASIAAI